MALIQPKQKSSRTQIRVTIDSTVVAEINKYCSYAGFQKIDEFIEKAAQHIMLKDKAFKDWMKVSMVV